MIGSSHEQIRKKNPKYMSVEVRVKRSWIWVKKGKHLKKSLFILKPKFEGTYFTGLKVFICSVSCSKKEIF